MKVNLGNKKSHEYVSFKSSISGFKQDKNLIKIQKIFPSIVLKPRGIWMVLNAAEKFKWFSADLFNYILTWIQN